MAEILSSADDEGRELPRGHESLRFGVSPTNTRRPAPGAIAALTVRGGFTIGPGEGRQVLFGRNKDEVHVCISEEDRRISRRHGVLTHRGGTWWVGNTGQVPIRMPHSQWLFPNEEEIPLAPGYTPLFIRGSGGREHLLEVYVVGPDGDQRVPAHAEPTDQPRSWRLDPRERLVLVALGQRYLRYEARPYPLGRRQVAELLADVDPEGDWTHRKVERVIAGVRKRLSKERVRGLTREEVPEPVGNWLNHNLLTELVMNSATLVPSDLALLEEPPEDDDLDA
ncbi:hypothetical protein ABZ897_58840 [Nonomuraea sp. NPDC046802]|uniref:hypothetical protein n=1 Tax=Nonomuraea sp. NPDC046802 TaxID=3154919 RepID=UPI0033DC5271